MATVVIDYGSGNLRSAAKAFERAARESGVSTRILVSSDPAAVLAAERVVLPGVGAFADCRRGLAAIPGMEAALDAAIRRQGRPFLGICVGLQLMAERGREFEITDGLGWIPGEVVAIEPADPALKIPHMGWTELEPRRAHPIVHSYRFVPADPADEIAAVDYGGEIAAVLGRDNMVGVQFHPEKSQATGLRLIANFLRWAP
jgi:glutamine amidotransferase